MAHTSPGTHSESLWGRPQTQRALQRTARAERPAAQRITVVQRREFLAGETAAERAHALADFDDDEA